MLDDTITQAEGDARAVPLHRTRPGLLLDMSTSMYVLLGMILYGRDLLAAAAIGRIHDLTLARMEGCS